MELDDLEYEEELGEQLKTTPRVSYGVENIKDYHQTIEKTSINDTKTQKRDSMPKERNEIQLIDDETKENPKNNESEMIEKTESNKAKGNIKKIGMFVGFDELQAPEGENISQQKPMRNEATKINDAVDVLIDEDPLSQLLKEAVKAKNKENTIPGKSETIQQKIETPERKEIVEKQKQTSTENRNVNSEIKAEVNGKDKNPVKKPTKKQHIKYPSRNYNSTGFTSKIKRVKIPPKVHPKSIFDE